MTDRSAMTLVLVPGAWLGGWSWLPAARRMSETGARVRALTLPGLAQGDSPAGLQLQDAVSAVVDEVVRLDLHDVVLVCHSWGGYPATGAAHALPDRVRKVVYYNAVVPTAGVSMADENEVYGALIHQAVASSPDGAVHLDLDSLRAGLLPDASAEVQQLVFDMTRPQPGGYMTQALAHGPASAASVECAYVLGVDDRALARPGEEFAARLGVEPVMVPGSHLAMLTRPADVAPAIIAACA